MCTMHSWLSQFSTNPSHLFMNCNFYETESSGLLTRIHVKDNAEKVCKIVPLRSPKLLAVPAQHMLSVHEDD